MRLTRIFRERAAKRPARARVRKSAAESRERANTRLNRRDFQVREKLPLQVSVRGNEIPITLPARLVRLAPRNTPMWRDKVIGERRVRLIERLVFFLLFFSFRLLSPPSPSSLRVIVGRSTSERPWLFRIPRCDLYQLNLSCFWDFREGSLELVSTIRAGSLQRTEFSAVRTVYV